MTWIRTIRVSRRGFASAAGSSTEKYKILVVGGGSAGLSVSNQIYDRFQAAGKTLNPHDVAIVDGSEFHHYQPGWTLVGSGLKEKTALRKRLADLIPSYIAHVPEHVKSFSPASSSITTTSGRTLSYDMLVVATGLQCNWSAIDGLPQALANSASGVSSIYSYDTCDKAWKDIDAFRGGRAIFTQPAGIIKCAGAPQKIMWMAWDRYCRTERSDIAKVEFYTGMPTMFSVKKYSDALNAMRIARGVHAEFQHNLMAVDADKRVATFKKADGSTVDEEFSLLHVVPPMGPLEVIKTSPLADAAGWVDIDPGTLQHKNAEFGNVFSLGDSSSLPTSKTAAAITSQAPVLTENLFSLMDTGKLSSAIYDGYTSCPLLTGYGELMLAEFKYGLEPKESFAGTFGDQSRPNRLFYHLKKDVFPWVYYNRMIQGKWFGPLGLNRPKYS